MSETTVEAIARLQALATPAIRARWAEAFGHPAPKHMSRDLLLRAVTYHMQAQAEGTLSKAALRRLAKLAGSGGKDGQVAMSPAARLKPGARLVREWHGEIHQVTVLDMGFDYRGTRYTSLSRIAHEITGTRRSGLLFFGLRRRNSTSAKGANAE